MAHKPPPVPPAERSHKFGNRPLEDRGPSATNPIPENLREQGRQGNIHQNTHNQGYQQDR
jgi:hypothetical protein